MKTLRQLAEVVAPKQVAAFGAIRRLTITLTAKALWQLAGFVIDGRTETVKAEPFTGIGIAARPPATGKPEAIVVMVGDAKNPMIIAVRDEKTRAAIAGAIKAGETMLFTPLSVVYMKDDGTIEARSPGGTAKRLALLEDLENHRAWVRAQFSATGGHVHTVVGGATTAIVNVAASPATVPPTIEPPTPDGTTKLKGE